MSLVIPRGGEGAWVCLISGGGGVKKRKSPDFSSLEVGISESGRHKSRNWFLFAGPGTQTHSTRLHYPAFLLIPLPHLCWLG